MGRKDTHIACLLVASGEVFKMFQSRTNFMMSFIHMNWSESIVCSALGIADKQPRIIFVFLSVYLITHLVKIQLKH